MENITESVVKIFCKASGEHSTISNKPIMKENIVANSGDSMTVCYGQQLAITKDILI